MKRKALLSLISFLYTLLFAFALDENIFIVNILAVFTEDGIVYGNAIDLTAFVLFLILYMGVFLFVVLKFEKIRGDSIYIYLSSLAASFFMPLFFDSLTSGGVISIQWYFVGIILLLQNLLIGSTMAFLLSYFTFRFLKKRKKYANVGLYIDKTGIIYAIPCGWDRITQKTVNTGHVDLLFILNPPYTDDDIESFLLNVLDNCFVKEVEPGLGALEKHFKVDGWLKAVRGMKYVSFSWARKKGYAFMPTTKTPRQGYIPQMDKQLHIECDYQKGALAKALHSAIDESTCKEINRNGTI